MSKPFVHLHTHSHYSLLSALPKINDLVKYAKELGMPALALTDNGNMYGAIEFYKACKKAGINPILGIDAYVAGRTRHDKQAGVDNRRSRLVLLAKDAIGYKSLIKLTTDAHLEGFYYKPRIDKELIEKYRDGLICIMPSFSGETTSALKNKDKEKAKQIIAWYKNIFGPDNFYLEITRHEEMDGHNELMKEIILLAKETDVPLVAAHDTYYLHPEDKKARQTLALVNSHADFGDKISDDDEGDFSFISAETIEQNFSDIPEAIDNTVKIATRCNLEITLGKWVFADYKLPPGKTHDDVLRSTVYEGIKKHGLEETTEVVDRIEYELSVIKNKGYATYFLTVSDLLDHAHKNGILTTIRGSVGGSLVTYLAGITNVNPLVYKLPFERFLNPERPSAPDIDMDYADNRRDEMIQYAREHYGADRVAQIGTFGTMMARGAVRDVARAMGFPYDLGDKISKMIPMGSQGFPMTIDHALEITPELSSFYKENKDVHVIIDMAKKIEGCARHISVHAAGVVIAPSPLTDYTPVQFDPKGGKLITQYDMHAVEDAGLLKFDFLGIKNLSILADAVALVKKMDNIDVDIERIPLDDKKTFEILTRGETIGLFQLNGTGMTKYLKELQPSTIHDINAMVALYRPGPIESIPQYIERKHDASKIKFLDPRMKDILSQSFGVITYQDDVMLIAIRLAGYSWLEADKLRKAMGKKIPAEMEAQKQKLHDGLIKNGMSEKKVNQLWKLIEPFAAYGFNKAHAASYGRVAYQTSYMKANFPAIYMSAVLTADSGDVEKIGEIITECKRMAIPVLPPDINESYTGFTVVKRLDDNDSSNDKIRFGLMTIKNFGEGIANAIIAERDRAGKFKSLTDFLDRVRDRNLNKKSMEALIKAGALDEMGERGVLLANLDALLAYNKEQATTPTSQDSLFGGMPDSTAMHTVKLQPAPPIPPDERLAWEKELLGLYISGHPLDKYKAIFEKRDVTVKKIKEEMKEGDEVVIGGIIEEAKPIATKKGDMMMFLRIADLTGSIETVVFPKVYAQFKTILEPERCIAIKGKVSNRNNEISLIVDKIKPLQ